MLRYSASVIRNTVSVLPYNIILPTYDVCCVINILNLHESCN
nr:MAG TPA: hypothetical protein [Caudoviricetes sp.]